MNDPLKKRKENKSKWLADAIPEDVLEQEPLSSPLGTAPSPSSGEGGYFVSSRPGAAFDALTPEQQAEARSIWDAQQAALQTPQAPSYGSVHRGSLRPMKGMELALWVGRGAVTGEIKDVGGSHFLNFGTRLITEGDLYSNRQNFVDEDWCRWLSAEILAPLEEPFRHAPLSAQQGNDYRFVLSGITLNRGSRNLVCRTAVLLDWKDNRPTVAFIIDGSDVHKITLKGTSGFNAHSPQYKGKL